MWLHNEQEIDTGVTLAGLIPRYTLVCFPPDADDPFKDLQMGRGIKNGLFGIQIDAQLDSLQRVHQVKEFAKATKSSDVDIPVYLWNKMVEGVDCEAHVIEN